MKKLLLFLLILWLCLPAGAFDVVFVFGDFTSTPATAKRLTLYPVSIASSNLVELITADRIVATTTGAGSATVTNMMCGYYRSELMGTSITTTNYFYFPCGTLTGQVNAKDFQWNPKPGIGAILWEENGIAGGRILFEP